MDMLAVLPDMITEVPELEFYDYLPTFWDETRVLQGSIGQYAVIARRSGANWFVGAMNAGTTRTFNLPLNFLPPGQPYVLNNYEQDATVPTRTQVRIDRYVVDSTTNITLTLAASRGQAIRLTPAVPPAFQKLQPQNNSAVSLVATGSIVLRPVLDQHKPDPTGHQLDARSAAISSPTLPFFYRTRKPLWFPLGDFSMP